MSRSTVFLSVVAIAVVLEGAWGAQQRQQQNDRDEDISDLKLLVPLLRVDDDEVPETEVWRANSESSSEEDAPSSVSAALSKLLNKLSGKSSQAPQAASYRPRVIQLGVHDHAEHQGRPCPICLLLNSLKALQQDQFSESRLDNRSQQKSLGLQRGNQRGSQRGKQRNQRGQQRGQQRAQRVGQRGSQGQQTCAVSVIELEEARRNNNPQDVGPQDGAPKDKPPAP